MQFQVKGLQCIELVEMAVAATALGTRSTPNGATTTGSGKPVTTILAVSEINSAGYDHSTESHSTSPHIHAE